MRQLVVQMFTRCFSANTELDMYISVPLKIRALVHVHREQLAFRWTLEPGLLFTIYITSLVQTQ